MLRRLAFILAAMLLAVPAIAQELPKFPKAGPPDSLPDAECDTTLPNNGQWLLGGWVAPQTRVSFTRDGQGPISWTMERKGTINQDFGWRDGATITGTVTKVTGCTVSLAAGEGDFAFEGVLAEAGKIYGAATNKAGKQMRLTLRRER